MSNKYAEHNVGGRTLFVDVKAEMMEDKFHWIGDSPSARKRLHPSRESTVVADALWDLLSLYILEPVYDMHFRAGLIAGVESLCEQYHREHRSFPLSRDVLLRFDSIRHIDALFYTHHYPEHPDARLVDQNGNHVDSFTVREFGFRVAFEFASRLADEVSGRGFSQPGHLETQWTSWNRPRGSDLDLIGRGWERSLRLVAECANICPHEYQLERKLDEEFKSLYEESAEFREKLISAIRISRLHRSTFKNGFGYKLYKPSADNPVFHQWVPVKKVEAEHVLELIERLRLSENNDWPDATWL